MDVERYVYVRVPRVSTVISAVKRVLKKKKMKILGTGLFITGVMACAVFPEDATGGAIACLIGACVTGCSEFR